MSNTNLIRSVASITSNYRSKTLAQSYGLNIESVAWEDTSRFKGSSVGNNISDMTLQVEGQRMPLIRKPNFSDLTADQSLDNFSVVVGNETGESLHRIPLREYLTNITKYTKNEQIQALLQPRDETILCSSQACILPLSDGKVDFSVALYNYQSTSENPAVLTIISTAQGTSCQVLPGKTSSLYFNHNGQAREFNAVRLKDDRIARGVSTEGAMTIEEKDKNVIFIYQVPLKYPEQISRFSYIPESAEYIPESACLGRIVLASGRVTKGRGMDHAIISVATTDKGPYLGTNSKKLERDDRFPIRCTLQYYHVTDEADVSEEVVKLISEELSKIYTTATATGSLVLSTSTRPTESPATTVVQPHLVTQTSLASFM